MYVQLASKEKGLSFGLSLYPCLLHVPTSLFANVIYNRGQ